MKKFLEMMNDKGMRAPYLASSLVILLEPANESQFRFIKDHISFRLIDFLINTSIPVTFYSNMLIFRDTNKSFKLNGDLLKRLTNYNFNVDHSNPQDQKIVYEFGNEISY